jgi:hypothetical protein
MTIDGLKTFTALTDGLPIKAKAEILGITPRSLRRYYAGSVPSPRVQAKIEEVLRLAASVVAHDDARLEEIRANREREARSGPYLFFKLRQRGVLPPVWRQFDKDVREGNWESAWSYGITLVEDHIVFGTVPDVEKPRILNNLYLAAARTGRAPEALEHISHAKELCGRDQQPLYKTILSNRAAALGRLHMYKEAWEEVGASLEFDADFVLAIYNGVCLASLCQDEDKVRSWLIRLVSCAAALVAGDIDRIADGLMNDYAVRWAREQGMIGPIVEELKDIRSRKEGIA